MDILKKYAWPGNIRELAAVVERYLVQTDGPIVRPEDLELGLYSSQGTSLGMKLSEWEEQQSKAKISYIMDTIEAAGSKSEAARRLGIKLTHLQYLLNESKAAKLGQAAESTSLLS